MEAAELPSSEEQAVCTEISERGDIDSSNRDITSSEGDFNLSFNTNTSCGLSKPQSVLHVSEDDNGSGSNKKEICRHNFPFRMIQKSYPKVYHSNRASIKSTSKLLQDSGNVLDTPRQSKQELLKAIGVIDVEILKTEQEIEKLKRNIVRTSSDKYNGRNSIHSVSKRIYSENQTKAEASHAAIFNISKVLADLSFMDTRGIPLLQENDRKFKSFRPKLLDYLRNKKLKEKEKEANLIEKMSGIRETWEEFVDNLEKGPERKKQLMENVQLFEEVMPELRIERERQEMLRSETVRTRNHQGKDFTRYLMERQGRFLTEEARARSCRIPPLKREDYVYIDNNNRLLTLEVGPRKLDWSEEERLTFREKHLEQPKNFTYIASFLKDRSVGDCILYYYLTKKTENYKEMVAMRDGRRARAARMREVQSTHTASEEIKHPQ